MRTTRTRAQHNDVSRAAMSRVHMSVFDVRVVRFTLANRTSRRTRRSYLDVVGRASPVVRGRYVFRASEKTRDAFVTPVFSSRFSFSAPVPRAHAHASSPACAVRLVAAAFHCGRFRMFSIMIIVVDNRSSRRSRLPLYV